MFLIVLLLGLYFYYTKRHLYSILFFLFLLTDGFQIIPEKIFLFGFNLFGKDYALIFSLTIFIINLFLGKISYPKNNISNKIILFLLYAGLALLVDLVLFSPSIIGSLLIFRVNLFLFTYFWLSTIQFDVYKKVYRILLKITVLQSFLCLLQIPLGIKLLTGGGIAEYNELGFAWVRYTNLPYFILPLLFILILDESRKISNRTSIIVLFLITLLFTLTRTLIIGLFVTISFGYIIGLLKKQKRLTFLIFFGFLLSMPLTGSRIFSSTQDFSNVINQSESDSDKTMTFTYRILHASERYIYIAKTLKGKIFGIGFVHEKNFPSDTFLLGHVEYENNYRITQLEQDDISWSNLFLRFGILGTSLYLLIFISFFRFFFKKKQDEISGSALLFCFMSFILTFSSGRFSQADFFVIPIFFFHYINFTHKKLNLSLNGK